MSAVHFSQNGHAQATGFSWNWRSWFYEKYLDVKYPLNDILHNALWGAFKRLEDLEPLLTSRSFTLWLDPQSHEIPKFIEEFSAKQITQENIERNLVFIPVLLYPNVPPHFIPLMPSQKRLKYLISRVDAIAKKMGIEKEIQIFAANHPHCSTAVIGGIWFKGSLAMNFNIETIEEPDEELDFIIAHELSHFKNNHWFKKGFFNLSVSAADAIAAVTVGIVFIPLIEGTATIASHAISRMHEKEADLCAMYILGTNRGAVKHFEKEIGKNKNIFFQMIASSYEKEALTQDGHLRTDFDHPSLITRLAYAREWIPAHQKMD